MRLRLSPSMTVQLPRSSTSVFSLLSRVFYFLVFSALLKITKRFECDPADSRACAMYVADVLRHDADHKWTSFGEHDSGICSHTFQISWLVGDLNYLRQILRNL